MLKSILAHDVRVDEANVRAALAVILSSSRAQIKHVMEAVDGTSFEVCDIMFRCLC